MKALPPSAMLSMLNNPLLNGEFVVVVLNNSFSSAYIECTFRYVGVIKQTKFHYKSLLFLREFTECSIFNMFCLSNITENVLKDK